MKKLFLISLLVIIAIQLAVPVQMIRSRETVLRKGALFRFITRPIDPADPFQGRYVRLNIKNDYVPYSIEDKKKLRRNTSLYAFIETDNEGYARFTSCVFKEPLDGDYLKSKYLRGWRNQWDEETQSSDIHEIQIHIPFNRFYMEESKAPRAERLAATASRSTNCWVNVRIYKGKAVIEDVFAGGISLKELADKKDE